MLTGGVFALVDNNDKCVVWTQTESDQQNELLEKKIEERVSQAKGIPPEGLTQEERNSVRNLYLLTEYGEDPIADFTFLAQFPNLTSLNIRSTQAPEVGTIEQLKGLTSLYLDCPIDNDLLQAVCKLKELDYFLLNVSAGLDLTPVCKTQISRLILSQVTGDTDLSCLAKAKQLTFLSLSGDDALPMSGLSELPSLNTLSLSSRTFSNLDFSVLAACDSLSSLGLYSSVITDLTPFASLTQIWDLSIDLVNTDDFSPLLSMPNLRRINVNVRNQAQKDALLASVAQMTDQDITVDVEIADEYRFTQDASLTSNPQQQNTNPAYQALVEAVEKDLNDDGTLTEGKYTAEELAPITVLEMDYNGASLTSLSFLKDMPALTSLTINVQAQLDYTPIGSLENLTKLFIQSDGQSLGDMSPIGQLTQLKNLYIDNVNSSEDNLRWVLQLNGLQYLTLNNICNLSIEELSTLQDLLGLTFEISSRKDEDLTPLVSLRNLEFLQIFNVPDTAVLQPLVQMPMLSELLLHFEGDHANVDCSFLKAFSKIRRVNFQNATLLNLDQLSAMGGLERLDLFNCILPDASPLLTLGITDITLLSCKLSQETLNALEKNCPEGRFLDNEAL